MRRSEDPTPATRSVGALLARWRDGAVARSEQTALAALQRSWARIVGGPHAADSGVASLRGGMLTLVARTETGARELTHLVDHIIAASNLALGRPLVRRVNLRVGEPPTVAVGDALAAWTAPRRELEPGERDECQRVSSVIEDEELRAAFESWMARHLAARGTRRPTDTDIEASRTTR